MGDGLVAACRHGRNVNRSWRASVSLLSLCAFHYLVPTEPAHAQADTMTVDMGLFGGILQPMLAGIPVTQMAPLAFLQRPARWLEAISNLGATAAGGPNFGYDLCVEAIKPEDREGLDLSRWRIAMNGAEPIRPAGRGRKGTHEPSRQGKFRSEVEPPAAGRQGGRRHACPILDRQTIPR